MHVYSKRKSIKFPHKEDGCDNQLHVDSWSPLAGPTKEENPCHKSFTAQDRKGQTLEAETGARC